MICQRWPLHPQPLSEESLLSWLTRIARSYDFFLSDLLEHDIGFYGDRKALNMILPAHLQTLLSNRTGVPEEVIHKTTLSSLVPFILDDFTTTNNDFSDYVRHYSVLLLTPGQQYTPNYPKSGWRPWITTPLSLSKACPSCSGKTSNIVTLSWYLPIMLSCPIHHCVLKPCFMAEEEEIYWYDENLALEEAVPAVKTMDYYTWTAITTGKVDLPYRAVHAGIWFRLLRTLLDELHRPLSYMSTTCKSNTIAAWKASGSALRAGRGKWTAYEDLPFDAQQKTLHAAACAIEQITNQEIFSEGSEAYLFLPAAEKNVDITESASIQNESLWKKAIESMHDMISTVIPESNKDP